MQYAIFSFLSLLFSIFSSSFYFLLYTIFLSPVHDRALLHDKMGLQLKALKARPPTAMVFMVIIKDDRYKNDIFLKIGVYCVTSGHFQF